MAVFKDFAENGELLGTHKEPLTAENLDRYIEQNGIEKAQAYFEALEDLSGQFADCYIHHAILKKKNGLITKNGYREVPNAEKFNELRQQKLDFLNVMKVAIDKHQQNNAPDHP